MENWQCLKIAPKKDRVFLYQKREQNGWEKYRVREHVTTWATSVINFIFLSALRTQKEKRFHRTSGPDFSLVETQEILHLRYSIQTVYFEGFAWWAVRSKQEYKAILGDGLFFLTLTFAYGQLDKRYDTIFAVRRYKLLRKFSVCPFNFLN